MNEKDLYNFNEENMGSGRSDFDKKFDAIFSNKLKQERDFIYTEPKWTRMERHLDNFLSLQRWQWLGWGLGASMATLVGLMTWTSWQLSESKENIQALTTEVQALKTEKVAVVPPSVPVVKNDTVYQTVIIKRYDTVYQTVVKPRRDDLSSAKSDIRHQKPEVPTPLSNFSKNTAENTQKPISEFSKALSTTSTTPPTEINNLKSETDTPLSKSTETDKKTAQKLPSEPTKTVAETTAAPKSEIENQKSEIPPPLSKSVADTKNSEQKPASEPTKTVAETTAALKSEIGNQKSEINTPLSDADKKEEKTANQPAIDAKTSENKAVLDNTSAKEIEKKEQKVDNKTEKKKEKINKKEEDKIAETPDNQQMAAPKPIIKPVKSSGFDIGIQVGRVFGEKDAQLVASAMTVGLNAGYKFNSDWKITGSVQSVKANFQTDNLDPKFKFPNVQKPSPRHTFQTVQGRTELVQYGLGVQRIFSVKRLEGFVGASILGQTRRDEYFDFVFKHPSEPSRTIHAPKRDDDTPKSAMLLRPQIGVNVRIVKKLFLQFESSYDLHLGQERPSLYPALQVKSGLFYRF